MGLSWRHWATPVYSWTVLQSGCRPAFLKKCPINGIVPPSHHFFSLQKYRVDMPGSNSAFIPTINAITTSQDLQWMVQPTVITSMSNPYSRSHPYGHHLTNGPGLLGHNTLTRPGVIRSIGDARGRRKRDEQVRDLGRPPADFFKRVNWTFRLHFATDGVLLHVWKRDCSQKQSKTPHLHRQALKKTHWLAKGTDHWVYFIIPLISTFVPLLLQQNPALCLNTRSSLQTACFICHLPFVFALSSPQRKRRRGGWDVRGTS